MNGIEAFTAERQRQIEQEGWTPEHDDQHSNESMALAAAWYALPESFRATLRQMGATFWPWAFKWWKATPYDRKREIVKAGALLAAEYDRLSRLEAADDN